ncbi:hypothetical protein BCR42DRAFT_401172 [Absidia repens]|uniref:Uncharacterized protein n=1 Tax=Absidia repens TaxID=90262 RepID=A0A1X2J246_9FUNG|nr:hypothetical protein BCR42DRAFT_401172 [Absidia repens]
MGNRTEQEHYLSSKKRKQKSSSSSSCSSSSRHFHSRDTTVLQSPRLLPFPYHNDSLFLPTVEKHRQLEKARSAAVIRSSSSFVANHRHFDKHTTSTFDSIHSVSSSVSSSSSQLSPSPSSSKRRKIIYHHRTCASTTSSSHWSSSQPTPNHQPGSSYSSSHSWIQKAWKVLTKSSWRRQFSSSTRAMTAFFS